MMDPNDPASSADLDLQGAAAITPVTEDMMLHAAHAAAELADGVARGTAHLADAPSEEAQRALADATSATSQARAEGWEALEQGASATAGIAVEEGATSRIATGAVGQYGTRLLDAVRVNVEAAGAHAAALAQAKSLPEAVAINADHVRRQLETLTGQARELSVLAQRALFETMQPLRGVLQRD